MSKEIDSRIVEMKFDNAGFEKGVSSTMSSLDKLKAKLNFSGAHKSVEDLSKATKHLSFDGMAAGIDSISSKFSSMGIVGVTALVNIANKAVNAGEQLLKSLTITPITQGFSEYELKLGSIQTILANTARYGTKVADVNAALDELNHYADKTIYDFGAMTTSIGQFTNAGLNLKDAVSIVKGFSNEAAASGATAEGAARAQIQLSQALTAGAVHAADWFSITNAGMGNKNMQDGLIAIANAMGTLKKAGTSTKEILNKGFKPSLDKGWLTANVMSTYLRIMAGDMTDAQIAALGLSKTMVQTFRKQQITAEEAATKVRTLSQLIGTMREAVGSGWSETFETIFGGFQEATNLFTKVNDVLGGYIQKSADARNKVLKDWRLMGGRTSLLKGIRNIFLSLSSVIKPIRDAFHDMFPPTTAKQLLEMTNSFKRFTSHLILSKDNMDKLHRTFRGVFAVLKIGTTIVSNIARMFLSLFTVAGHGTGGILSLTAAAGDFLTKISQWATTGGGIKKFFDVLIAARTAVLLPLVDLVSALASAIADLAHGDVAGFKKGFNDAFTQLGNTIFGFGTKLSKIAGKIGEFGGNISDLLKSFGIAALSPITGALDTVVEKFHELHDALSFKFELAGFTQGAGNATGSLSKLSAVGTALTQVWNGLVKAFTIVGNLIAPITKSLGGLFSVILDKLKEYIKGMDFQDALALFNTGVLILLYRSITNFTNSMSKVMNNLAGLFNQLQNSLKSMQHSVKANVILKIAIAVGILTASVVTLTQLDPKKLTFALGALTALFVQLGVTLAAFNKFNLVDQKGLVSTGTGLVLLALAIRVLVSSVVALGKTDTKVLIKGLLSLNVMLLTLAGTVKLMNGVKGIPAAALGILILAEALMALSLALRIYAAIPWDTMGKGLLLMSAALVAIGLSMRTMPRNMPSIAFGLLIVSGALIAIAAALKVMGSMSIKEIAKAVGTLAITLTLLATAANTMVAALPGAAGIFLIAAALAILAPTLAFLGKLSWGTIAKGLITIALVFGVLGIAAALLTPVIPSIFALGIALMALAKAMLLAGLGFGLFAAGFAAFAAVGAAGVAVAITAFEGLLALIPTFMQQLGLGVLAFIKVFADSAGAVVNAFVKILIAMLQGAQKVIPEFVKTMWTLIMSMAKALYTHLPVLVEMGLRMLMSILTSIKNHTYEITKTAIGIVFEFLRAFKDSLPGFIQAGIDLITSFLHGLADGIRSKKNQKEMSDAGKDIGEAIVEGIGAGIKGLGHLAVQAAKDLAKSLPGWVQKVLKIQSPSKVFYEIGQYTSLGLAQGITSYSGKVQTSAETVGTAAVDALRRSISEVSSAVSGDMVIAPIIAPIIDLSHFRRGAGQMAGLLSTSPISASLSYGQASSISADRQAARVAELMSQTAGETTPTVVQFEQNNYSPTPLSTTDIYRQTNNQLSLAKKKLGIPA